MMLSPKGYYELNLKGKTPEEINATITALREEISKLKETLEDPNYCSEIHSKPSERTKLNMALDYLEEAKLALSEAGGAYIPTKQETKAAEFYKSIDDISKITFSFGSFFSGYESKEYDLNGNALACTVEHGILPNNHFYFPDAELPMKKKVFLDRFAMLNIGGWRSHYTPERFGIYIMDGNHWKLTVEYSDGQNTVEICGSNAYPYNFCDLCDLFGLKSR